MLKNQSPTVIIRKFIAVLMASLVCPLLLVALARMIGWRIPWGAMILPSAIMLTYVIVLSWRLRDRLLAQAYAFDHMPDGIILVNEQLQTIYANPAAKRIMNLGRSGHQGDLTVAELILQHDNLLSLWEGGWQGHSAVDLEGRHLEVERIPMQMTSRRSVSLVVLRDVTERHRSEQELIRQATTDGLTRLYNRRYFLEKLEEERQRCASTGSMLSLVLIDVDYFKLINDTYGHLAGDRVLQQIAVLLQEFAGENGVAGRIGGEEFAVYWPGIDGESAYRRTEELRMRVLSEQPGLEEVADGTRAGELQYTISAGIVELDESHKTLESWLEEADACLYASKKNGRNQTTLAMKRKT